MSPHDWDQYLYKRGHRELPCPMCHVIIQEICELKEETSREQVGALISDYKFLLFINCSVWYFVTVAQMDQDHLFTYYSIVCLSDYLILQFYFFKVWSLDYIQDACFTFYFFNVYLFLRERQTDRWSVSGRWAEREGDTASEAGSRL